MVKHAVISVLIVSPPPILYITVSDFLQKNRFGGSGCPACAIRTNPIITDIVQPDITSQTTFRVILVIMKNFSFTQRTLPTISIPEALLVDLVKSRFIPQIPFSVFHKLSLIFHAIIIKNIFLVLDNYFTTISQFSRGTRL